LPQTPIGSNAFGGRQLTSHERHSGQPWDASYQDGPAPWDIEKPQPAIVQLAKAGGFAGTVLDAGCGSGENTLYLASLGIPILGVDVAENALEMARRKAQERGIEAEFAVGDGLQLEGLGRSFRTVLDCGLFHTFDAEERLRYVEGLTSVTEDGGRVHILCFSDEGADAGPHPVSRRELKAAFSSSHGWATAAVQSERIHTRFHGDDGAPAWLATMSRIA
jgi:SAM-dependent methyltransferase